MRKRAVSLILCLCMVLSLVPVPALAQNAENDNPFSDVDESDWFYNGVQYVFEHELMKGTNSTIFETLFEPERATQRGMIVTILYRLDGSPPVTDTCPFEDVPRGSNYENAIIWAASNGIVTGYTNTSFGPYDDITRQQMAAILYRYANVKRYDVTKQANLNVFTDSGRISNYARIPLSWANAEELINGITSTMLAPTEKVTRAQSAVILTRFCENIVEGSVKPSPTATYTVTFDLNYTGAGANQKVSVEQGKTVSEPDTPKRTGYDFGGWYTTAVQQKTRFNFNTAINADITLYARWTSNRSSSNHNTSSDTPAVTYYTVTFDSNGGSEAAPQQVKSGECATEPANIVREGYNLTGWYTAKNAGEKYDFSTPVTADRTLYAHWTIGEITDTTDSNNNGIPDSLDRIMGYGTDHYDSDDDGVPDFYEEILETDKNKADTDGDGLPDGYELFRLGTDPLKSDTDDDGISDAEADNDNDGLKNIQEYEAQTNPNYEDTDYDGLTDDQEVIIYTTNPLIKDTDEDGLNDWDELAFSMNPLNPCTLNDGILDGDRTFNVSLAGTTSDNGDITPKLEMSISGKQIESLSIDKVDNSDVFLNDNIPGYLGNAYAFSVDGDFSVAKVSFELSEGAFSDGSNPTIFYWDEEAQALEEVSNTQRRGNVLRAELSHFSSYIVLDKNLYDASVLEYEIKAPTDEELQNKAFDIALVLDDSGSVNDDDFRHMRQVCLNFLENLTDEDRVAVFTFVNPPRNLTRGLTSKSEAASKISNYTRAYGWTPLYDAIDVAIDELSGDTENSRIIIVLTDGDDWTSSDSNGNKTGGSKATDSSVIEHAINSGVAIYTVGVGTQVRNDILTRIAESTHGNYNFVDNFSALNEVFERIAVDTDLYKDSDEDGISDYHEKAIASGHLKIGTGVPIPSAGNISHLKADSDNDGLSDDEEVTILERTVDGKTVYYCRMYSNPCLSDTDGDGLDDYAEVYAGFEPLSNDLTHQQSRITNTANLLDVYDFLESNSFLDWIQLGKDKHAPNFIHNFVEREIRYRYREDSFLQNEYRINLSDEVPDEILEELRTLALESRRPKLVMRGKLYGSVDLLKEPDPVSLNCEIWEVKPSSYQTEPKHAWADKQLESYILAALYSSGDYQRLRTGGLDVTTFSGIKVKGTHIESGHIPSTDGKGTVTEAETDGYEIDYMDNGDGLILYRFTKAKREESDAKESEAEKDFIERLIYMFPLLKLWKDRKSGNPESKSRPIPSSQPDSVPEPAYYQGTEEEKYPSSNTLFNGGTLYSHLVRIATECGYQTGKFIYRLQQIDWSIIPGNAGRDIEAYLHSVAEHPEEVTFLTIIVAIIIIIVKYAPYFAFL